MPSSPSLPSMHGQCLLLRLPDEVLALIFCHLRAKDLSRVTLVCQQVRASVEPYLYRDINLRLRNLAGTLHHLPGLISALRQKRQRSYFVKSLRLHLQSGFSVGLVEETLDLLYMLPSLQSLNLSPPPTLLDLSRFPRLNTLKFGFREYSGQYHAKNSKRLGEDVWQLISQSVSHSSLRHLTLSEFRLNPKRFRTLFTGHSWSFVTYLRLLEWDFRSFHHLPSIIRSIQHLTTLHIEVLIPYGQSHYPERIALIDLFDALSSHASTIEELMILSSEAIAMPTDMRLSGMAHFTALRKLTIPENVLADAADLASDARLYVEALPPHIEELRLQGNVRYGPWIDVDWIARRQALRQLADEKPAQLRRVVLWMQLPNPSSEHITGHAPLEELHSLRRRFTAANAHFEWACGHYLDYSPFSDKADG